jgi:cytochrome c oxidase cbb3-type subunit IV
MDLTTIRIVIELFSFAVFIGILAWAFSSRRKDDFAAAAQLPFQDREPGP